MTPPGARKPRGSGDGSRGNRRAKGTGPAKGSGPRFAGSTKPSQPTKLPRETQKPAIDVHDPDGVRLQKLLAGAGVGSRRACEALIAAGVARVVYAVSDPGDHSSGGAVRLREAGVDVKPEPRAG